MSAMKEIREKMMEHLSMVTIFSTLQMRDFLLEQGYTYNKDYNVRDFSNAISSLVKQGYIKPEDKNSKTGIYQVINQSDSEIEENPKKKDEDAVSGDRCVVTDPEIELEEFRSEVKEKVKEFSLEIEEILDGVKPSVYGRNKNTYEDILCLIKYLKEFKFTVDED